jgi:hypothetical protein
MPAVFCSQCGERLNARRKALWPDRVYCVRCAPVLRRIRLRVAAVLLLAALVGFTVGRLTSSRRPFYFIGTPVGNQSLPTLQSPKPEPGKTEDQRSSQAIADQDLNASQYSNETVCGAKTRAGKPCRRKVRFGGPCWQHRSSAGAKQPDENNRAPAH